jgi:hypothetical protein
VAPVGGGRRQQSGDALRPGRLEFSFIQEDLTGRPPAAAWLTSPPGPTPTTPTRQRPELLLVHGRDLLAAFVGGRCSRNRCSAVSHSVGRHLTPGEYVQAPENASSALGATMGLLAGNPVELGAVRMNWRTADPELLAALKTAVLADGTDREFLAYLNTLEPDEALDAGGPADRARKDS